MRAKASLLLLLVVSAVSAAQNPAPQGLTTTQIAAWLIGGVPSVRLARLVAECKLATLPSRSELSQLEGVGADKGLMQMLGSGNVLSAAIGDRIPAELVKASEAAR